MAISNSYVAVYQRVDQKSKAWFPAPPKSFFRWLIPNGPLFLHEGTATIAVQSSLTLRGSQSDLQRGNGADVNLW